MTVLKRFILVITGIVSIFVTSSVGYSSNIKVIENPKPTMKETKIRQLVKIGEIGPEVGEDQFIFSPISFDVDESENLFVFDRMQSKIMHLDAQGKFVKSFGRHGEGPGEFGAKGRGYLVQILLNSDNLIYANDTRKFKILVFNREGRYLNEMKYEDTIYFHAVDGKGNLLLYDTKNGTLEIFNNNGEVYYSYPIRDKKIQYLFKDTTKMIKSKRRRLPKKSPYHLGQGEISLLMTRDGKLLVIFPKSATMLVIKDKKLLKEVKIWPEQALRIHKTAVQKEKNARYSLFKGYFLDKDDPNVIYFRLMNREKRVHRLYRINLQGQLLSVFDIEIIGDDGFPIFRCVKNGRFYTRYDDKIHIFKEKNK